MKSIFEKNIREAVIERINLLHEDSDALWGKMTVTQLLIEQYETFEKATFVHWFFGRMSRAQLGQFIYKHCNHHLKQFGT
ncbi:DUF1569 domain-containing protein [Sphingobacterium multivorum]|uniref:DUF1569 domain-containing protein n=1 Tax=Sphingobacterium multivorum TaxID=28454 RepID=UPI00289D54EC|nr:DUF1569 domain-containing protein [Sphingobacterium multivorum]